MGMSLLITNILEIAAMALLIYAAILIYKREMDRRFRLRRILQTPDIQNPAKLIAKAIGTAHNRPGFGSHAVGHLAFEFPNGVRKDFTVELSIYNILQEGEQGILTYKEQGDYRIFINFARQI